MTLIDLDPENMNPITLHALALQKHMLTPVRPQQPGATATICQPLKYALDNIFTIQDKNGHWNAKAFLENFTHATLCRGTNTCALPQETPAPIHDTVSQACHNVTSFDTV